MMVMVILVLLTYHIIVVMIIIIIIIIIIFIFILTFIFIFIFIWHDMIQYATASASIDSFHCHFLDVCSCPLPPDNCPLYGSKVAIDVSPVSLEMLISPTSCIHPHNHPKIIANLICAYIFVLSENAINAKLMAGISSI